VGWLVQADPKVRNDQNYSLTYRIIVSGLSWGGNVDISGGRGNDFNLLGVFRLQEDVGSVCLVNCDGWDRSVDLSLDGVSIDDFEGSDDAGKE
jgi:hypothetical protein